MRFLAIAIAVLVSLDIAAREVGFAQEAATSYGGVAHSISSSAPTDGVATCDKPGGMGLSRVVKIDTTGGPVFGFGHFKQYDFLRDKEIVLTRRSLAREHGRRAQGARRQLPESDIL